MENGVKNVEEGVGRSNVKELDRDGLGESLKDMEKDEHFEEASGSVKEVQPIVELEEAFVTRKDENVPNGGQGVIDTFEDAIGTPRVVQTVAEEPCVVIGEPFQEVTMEKVIDNQSMADDDARDEPSVLENEKPLDDGEDKGNVLNMLQADAEKNASDSAQGDQLCELEIHKSVGDGKDAKALNFVQATDEKCTSDDVSRDQLIAVEADELMDNGKDEAKTSDVLELKVVKTDGVAENPINDVKEVFDGNINVSQMVIQKDVDEVKEYPVVVLGDSENGVSDKVDPDEAVIHEYSVNGDAANQESSQEDVSNQLHKVMNGNDILDSIDKDDDSRNQAEKVDNSRNHLLNLETELKVEQAKEEHFNPSSRNLGDKDVKLDSISAINELENSVESLKPKETIHDSMDESTVTTEVESTPSVEVEEAGKIAGNSMGAGNAGVRLSELGADHPEKCEFKDNKLDGSMPVNREPEPRPVTVAFLAKENSATPSSIPNHKPPPSPITDSKPSAAPTLSPSPVPTRPAGLGRGAPLLEPAPRVVQSQVNGTVAHTRSQVIDGPTNGEAEDNDETREKLQMIRVKFLRLARRLGQTPHNVVVAQVLYRLGLAEQLRGRNGGRVAAFSFERASDMAEQLEAAGQEPLDFSCTIMVLGKTGVGKSATINSIFDEVKFGTDAFQLGTKKVQDVVGTVQGIKVRVIDTPGLLPSWADQKKNEKILHSVKRFIQKSPPDIVLYLDRLDMQTRDSGDMPLLRTITDIFGPSIWFNAIVVLTHAASAPPEGPSGISTGYDMFVTQRSHVVQQAIRQAAGDMRLMNPVSLVENHSACRTNRAGQRVLPNGQVWKPHLLLLSFASKILVEANMLLKLQDTPPGRTFAARTRSQPLPFILSNLLQSRPQLKLPQEQFGGDDDDTLDGDLDESSDEEPSEYDDLPPFKRLTRSQLAQLNKEQKKAYYDELEYREKLFMKKQLKEEKKRRKMMKKMAEASKDMPSDYNDNNVEDDSSGSATVPVAIPDMNLPASFDSDNPTHRYRALDSANQWLVRPVLDPHGWDHDVGYEGINVEHLLTVKDKIPVSFSGQVTKDKKDANIQMEVASSVKHGEGKSTTLAFDMQTVGKELSYTLRSETRFINYRQNKATAGLAATYFGDSLTAGLKFEDKLMVHKRGQLVVAGGAVIGRGDVAYGGSLEATLRDKDYPLGRFLSTIGLSVMDWHGDLALGWNSQLQIPVGRSTNLISRVNLNNKGSGQVSIRLNSSEQLQIALVSLIPLFSKLVGYCLPRDPAY